MMVKPTTRTSDEDDEDSPLFDLGLFPLDVFGFTSMKETINREHSEQYNILTKRKRKK
ncbi:MAG: hypothetical protein IMZ53_01035 [Thermoplasmata archaeon]|nr:hypothetical protein [Thermoplasmata archaeon]MBE3139149.1 hypothetical protein [Thermoplasmata archaeon]